MLIAIDQVLSPEEVQQFRQALNGAEWEDGLNTAGTLARAVKRNQQLADGSDVAVQLGQHILRRLAVHPLFISAALPAKIYPPKFNRYAGGGTYGAHVDSAVMQIPGTQLTLRSDLSATLFLAEPDEYDGGELEIEGPFGVQTVKLAAGDMVLYPSSSIHEVKPVTRGTRIVCVGWIESLIADQAQREMLFDLENLRAALHQQLPLQSAELLTLDKTIANLLRMWARA